MSSKTERLEVRVEPAHKQLIERAAALTGQVVSQFVVSSALKGAEEVLRQTEWTVLAARDREAFLEIIDSDEQPTSSLIHAFERHATPTDRE